MIQRRIPKIADLAPLMRFKTPEFNAKKRRLDAALTIADLRAIARKRTPKAAFDYTEGAAEAEISLGRARQAFEDIEFHPSILRDVSSVSTGWDVLGAPVSQPFGIAPTGFTRMMQTEGEIAGAHAAARAGIPFALSTMGTNSIEDVKAANPNGRNWFQLYMWKDRDRSMALVDRAATAGYDTLLVTVDVPVAGARLRDKRNGFSIPPALTLGTVVNALPRPEWWINFLTTEPLSFASLDRWSGTVADLLDSMFDPTVDFEDLAWIKAQWPGKVVVKGVQNIDDAKRLVDLGGGLLQGPGEGHLLGCNRGVEPAAQLALLRAGQPDHLARVVGGPADQGERLQHRVVHVRRDLSPLLGADALAPLGPQVVRDLQPPGTSQHRDAGHDHDGRQQALPGPAELADAGQEAGQAEHEQTGAQGHRQQPSTTAGRAGAPAGPLRLVGLPPQQGDTGPGG